MPGEAHALRATGDRRRLSPRCGQALDTGNVQVHGFARQGFLYAIQNRATTNSSGGSAAWTEAVANLTAQPEPKLRIRVRARYFLLGGNPNLQPNTRMAMLKLGASF